MINYSFLNNTFNDCVDENKILNYEKDGVEYNLNKYGFRSPEFINNVDLLTLGCSNTWGYGLPKELTWPYILSSKNNLSLNSLAKPGISAQSQVIFFFKYVEKFGNPKNVAAVFPAYRFEFPLASGFWEQKSEESLMLGIQKTTVYVENIDNDKFEKFAKAPYEPQKMFSREQARYYTHLFIYMLKVYCNNNNINFKYSIWDPDYSKKNILSSMMEKDESFVFSDESLGHHCHYQYISNKYFLKAADWKNNNDHGHFTFHRQLHLYESMQNALFGVK